MKIRYLQIKCWVGLATYLLSSFYFALWFNRFFEEASYAEKILAGFASHSGLAVRGDSITQLFVSSLIGIVVWGVVMFSVSRSRFSLWYFLSLIVLLLWGFLGIACMSP